MKNQKFTLGAEISLFLQAIPWGLVRDISAQSEIRGSCNGHKTRTLKCRAWAADIANLRVLSAGYVIAYTTLHLEAPEGHKKKKIEGIL